MTLAYAGCRASEALALIVDRVSLGTGLPVFEGLRKGGERVYRSLPARPLLDVLDMLHGLREQQAARSDGLHVCLWPWSRMNGWRAVHEVMVAARLEKPNVSPKGLRQSFGLAAVPAGIPLNLVQKWLGYAQLTTMAISVDASVLARKGGVGKALS